MTTEEKLRRFEAAGGTFELRVFPEDMPVRGNLCATDEPDLDRQEEDKVLRRLNNGDEWAWCRVEVHAVLDGNFSGVDHLGGCSYESEADFKRGEYYADMCLGALDDLLRTLQGAQQHGEEAAGRLKELTE